MATSFWNIKNGLRFTPLSSAPSSPAEGDVYFDSGLSKLRVYQGGSWINITDSDGTVLLSDGAVGTPSLAFTNDTDTGAYLSGTNSFSIAAGGSEALRLTTSGATIPGRIATAGASIDSTALVRVGVNGSSPLVGTTGYGVYSKFFTPSTMTTLAGGFNSELETAAAAFTLTFGSNYRASGVTSLGAGSAITRFANIRLDESSSATSNALITDSTSFTAANWAIFLASTRASSFGGQMQGPNGTVGAPSWSFTSDTDCGLYRVASNQVGMSAGGVLATTFTSAYVEFPLQLRASDGTAGAPGLSFLNDADCGLYRVGTNSFGFATAGLDRGSITAAGLWIIGSNGGTENHSIRGTYTAFTTVSAGTATFTLGNTGTGSTDYTQLKIGTAHTGTGGGDASIWFNAAGVYSWVMGFDQSASGAFKLSYNTNTFDSGGSNYLTISGAGAYTISSGGTQDHTWGGNSLIFGRGSTEARMEMFALSSGSVDCAFYASNTAGAGVSSIIRQRGNSNSAAPANQVAQLYQYGTSSSNRILARVDILNTNATVASSGGRYRIQTSTTAGTATTALEINENQVVNMSTGGIRTKISTADVSNPPTDAELDSAFGTPATVGSGFVALVNDNNGGTNEYMVWSDGTNWFYTTGTKAV